jgi:hypothetical protein
MSRNQKQWWKVGLALIPSVVYLAASFIIAANENLWRQGWITEPATLASAVIVIGLLVLHERRLTLWLLVPAVLGLLTFMSVLTRAIWGFVPEVSYQPHPLYTTVQTLMFLVGLFAFNALLGLTFKLAQKWGAPASMGLLVPIGLVSLGILDPTYGMLVHDPDLVVETAALSALIQLPYLIILPLWVLAARSESRQRIALFIVPGIAYALALCIQLFFAIPLNEGIPGAPSLAQMTAYTLRSWPVMTGIAWAVQIGIVLLCGKLQRSDPQHPVSMRIPSSISV